MAQVNTILHKYHTTTIELHPCNTVMYKINVHFTSTTKICVTYMYIYILIHVNVPHIHVHRKDNKIWSKFVQCR